MSNRIFAGAALLAAAALFFFWPRRRPGETPPPISPPVVTTPAPAASPKPPSPPIQRPRQTRSPERPTAAAAPAAAPAQSPAAQASPPPTAPTPPPAPVVVSSAEVHQELIPREITIARCYYTQKVAAPGTTFGLDIDGSGFNAEFEKMITMESGADDVRIRSLRLVTANQIHADVEIGPAAATAFVYPKVLIKGVPVFRAPKPFGVVRRGEVLTIEPIGVSADGLSARFRVVTNIDENMFAQFWVAPTKPGPKVSPMLPTGPFSVEGTLEMGDARPGEYGLIVSIFSREVYRQGGFNVASHNVGKSGLAARVSAADRYHRPGDRVQLDLIGAGFSREDASSLEGRVTGYDMGKAAFEYASPTAIRVFFSIPASASEGAYGVAIAGQGGKTLVDARDVFTIVPPLWLRGVRADPPARPGGRGVLKVLGRDLTAAFAGALRIETDEPGIRISSPLLLDDATLAADLEISSSVAAGDYLLALRADGKILKPQSGSIIQVMRP